MRKIILIVAPILLAYLIASWFTGHLAGPAGAKVWILRGALWLIGIVAAAVVVWFVWNKKKQEEGAAAATEETPSGGEEIGVLLRDAERKLASAQLAKGARIGNLPAILLLGETSSTKTSTVLHSGLEPELLAGQVYQDGNVTATRSANLWFSRRTLFVEAGGKMLEDAASRNYLVKRLQPRKLGAVVGKGGQAPRAALVCVEIERITGGAQAMATTARNLRARLGEISQSFGIQLPVYVLFTKTDRLPFFADYVRNLTNEEATQALGVTLPIAPQTAGVWAEVEAARLGNVFDQIFRSLCDARPEFLSRENDAAKLPGTYEFPREFRKLRGSLVQFLADLCRPSQLTVGPFLRGFYFSGVRPVIVQETAAAPESRAPEKQGMQNAKEATAMFRIPGAGQAAAAAPQQRMAVSRKVPQWVFLTHFFNDVLLADRVAMGASGSSTKASLWRRVLLISAAVLALIFCVGFTVSFFLNRGLEAEINTAMKGTTLAPAGANLASVDSLRRLEALRQSLETLTLYNREGAPLRYRWGLYVGDSLYPDVWRLYFSRFKQLQFGQTQNTLVSFLNGLPPAPGPATPGYDQAYDSLKAYLITTSNNDKSTREFLSPVLLKTWSGSQTVDPERLALAQKQFDFYSEELKVTNPFTKTNDMPAIKNARAYLSRFADFERVYQAIKAGAPKTSVNFNRQYPGSKEYVVDNYEVAGPFTKKGWEFMSAAIRNPDRYAKGEPWVLGDQGAADINDHRKLIEQLLARYQADFIREWRTYLNRASVVKYKDLKDAAQKLNVFSSNQSHLLGLFELASENTVVDDQQVKKSFQPVQYLVPAGSERWIGPQNQDYITALAKLQQSVEGAAGLPEVTDSAANQTLSDAGAAKLIIKQIASQRFNPDPEGHVDAVVQQLLEDPIINTEALLKGLGPAELNAKGKDLCGKFRAVLNKYPFSPTGKQDATVAELNSILAKPDGAFWQFYETSLKKILPKKDTQYVPVPGAITLTQPFVTFFNQAAAFSETLYSAGPDPHFTYSLKAVPTEGVQKAGLEIDGQKLDYAGGLATAKQFTWQGSGPHGAKGMFGSESYTFTDNDGLWAVFRLFGEADHRERSPAGGELLDWIPRTGASRKPVTLPSGKPLTVRFELDMGAAPHIFESHFFSRLGCVAEVAKP